MKYTGRLPRERFTKWAGSPEGRSALKPVAEGLRFALFGRMRAARRRVWHQLAAAARDHDVCSALQREVDRCLAALDTLAHARDLPRATIEMYRLVAVPRFFVNATAYRHIDASLKSQPAFGAIEGGAAVRGWFVLVLIEAIEAAVAAARPSPSRPLAAGERWFAVGLNQQFVWRAAFQGPSWPGHYYVLEQPRTPMKRKFRKAASEAIAQLEASLPSLSAAHKTNILREAGASLEQMAGRA